MQFHRPTHQIKRGSRPMRLPDSKIKSGQKAGALYAYPRQKSIRHFKDQIRRLTCRRAPVTTTELIQQINPVLVAGASITSALTSDGSSINSMAGSCGASGRIGSGVGAVMDGAHCRPRSSMASCTW